MPNLDTETTTTAGNPQPQSRTADIVLPDPILDALSELYWLERAAGCDMSVPGNQ